MPDNSIKPNKTAHKKYSSIFQGPNRSDQQGVKMAMQQLPLPGEIVKKSNAIARARWQPESIWEPRIVALVASKVRVTDEDFLTYRIPVAELAGVPDENLRGNQYQEIRKSIEHLGKATIRIEGNKPRNFRQYNIFSMCGYEDGYLIAGFHPDLKPHFLGLGEKFTEYSLMQYLMLPSGYSQQIFEFLKSWANVKSGEVLISVAELHEILNTPESMRADFRQFRTRVLEKAHKDIQEKTSLRFEWQPVKAGRSVVKILFSFGPGRRAIAEAEKKKLKEEKQRQLINERTRKAFVCAVAKKGECATQDQRPRICKLCLKMSFCDDLRKRGGKPFDPMEVLR